MRDSKELEELLRDANAALRYLMRKYWCNKGTEDEFITGITPRTIPEYWILAAEVASRIEIKLSHMDHMLHCELISEPGFEPVRSTEDSAGYDIRACSVLQIHRRTPSVEDSSDDVGWWLFQGDFVLRPGDRVLFGTGVKVKSMDRNFHLEVRSKSGKALNYGLVVTNSPGTIDSDYLYPKEIGVILLNTGTEFVTIKKGDYIAQLVLTRQYEIGGTITKEERRRDGFGSTGTR